MSNLSQKIFESYKKDARDHDVHQYRDVSGIQVIRNYSSSKLKEKKQFIKLYIDDQDRFVAGVDMVKEGDGGTWTIIFPDDSREMKDKSNYIIYDEKEYLFDKDALKISYKNRKFNINEFIDFLEKNHHRDMFRVSRWINSFITLILHLIFAFVDKKYKRNSYLFSDQLGSSIRDVKINKIEPDPDPLFKFFRLYKNPFSFVLGLVLPISFYLSTQLDPTYFSVSNPFLIFLVMAIFLVIEGIGTVIVNSINSKDSLVLKLAEKTLRQNGKLK